MTLGLGIVSKWGAWVSTDFRVTWTSGGTKNDTSQKHLVLRCPDGGVLLAYTGLAEVLDGRTVNEWVCDLLRGTTRTIVESLQLVCTAASRELAPICTRHRIRHIFMFASFVGQIRWDGVKAACDETWTGLITNLAPHPDCERLPPEPTFKLSAMRAGDNGWAWAAGSGRPGIIQRDRDLMVRIAGRRASRPIDYCNVLGNVNKRAAARARETVSAACSVTYMPPTIEPFEHHVLPVGAQGPAIVPLLFVGIDLGVFSKAMMDWQPGMPTKEWERLMDGTAGGSVAGRSDEK